jgi:hypothetical protein
MNNDKRIILAIALYAAVITMVLHTLTTEGHQRFNVAEEHTFKYNEMEECTIGMISITPPGVCYENECFGPAADNGVDAISKFVKENSTSLEVDNDAHS